MAQTWFLLLCEVSLIASALVAGVFLTFSDLVMRSLDGANTSASVEVMQAINREVFKTIFMGLLLGMCVVSAFLLGHAYVYPVTAGSDATVIGALVYLVGVLGVTLVFNVPMNNRLASKEYAGPEAAAYWTKTYFPYWTFWNWVRAIASAVASISFLIACLQLAQSQ